MVFDVMFPRNLRVFCGVSAGSIPNYFGTLYFVLFTLVFYVTFCFVEISLGEISREMIGQAVHDLLGTCCYVMLVK